MSQRAAILKMLLKGVTSHHKIVTRTQISDGSVHSIMSTLRAEGIVEGGAVTGYKIIDEKKARFVADGGKLVDIPTPQNLPNPKPDYLSAAWPEPGFMREPGRG